MEMVVVTNKNEETFSQRFDGQVYEFAPGKQVSIPERVAAWIFAYGKPDDERTRIMVRNGWLKVGGDQAKAKAILGNFVFNTLAADSATERSEKRKLERVMTGINAVSPPKEDGTVVNRERISLNGKAAPLAAPAKAA